LAELSRLTTMYLPKLLDARISEIHNGIRSASKKPPTPVGEVARVEPQSQGTVVPSAMGKDEIRKWAETEAAKDPAWTAMNGMDREALIMSKAMKKRLGG
jgi:hypothetical protein